MMSGAESEAKLRQEVERLLKLVEEMKAKHKQEMEQLETKLNKQREMELKGQKERYEQMMNSLKA